MKSALDAIAAILVVIGGLNWGLIGSFDLNVIALLGETVAMIVYILVGLSALWMIYAMSTKK